MKSWYNKTFASNIHVYIISGILPLFLIATVYCLASDNGLNSNTMPSITTLTQLNNLNFENNIKNNLFMENIINFIKNTEENSEKLSDILYSMRVSKQRFWINLDMIPLDKMDLYLNKINTTKNINVILHENNDYSRYVLSLFLEKNYTIDYLTSNIHWYVYNLIGLLASPSTVLEVLFYKSSFVFYPFFFMLFTNLLVSFNQPYLNLKNIAFLSIFGMGVFLLVLIVFAQLITQEGYSYFLDVSLHSIYIRTLNFSFSFCIDTISMSFGILILFISISAVIYSCIYLKGDQNASDFLVKLVWFSFSMLCLVFSRNIANFYLSWEFIGITSAWLINFNSSRLDTLKSALKAFSFNKLSDLAIISGLLICYYEFESSNFQDWILLHNIKCGVQLEDQLQSLTIATALLVLSASIKSAQIGFHIWLPDSMDAPVPASALIHSATLVSAGVYVLIRFYYLIDFTGLGIVISVLGSITGAYGGIVAGLQTDLKKALAYSTISHCGFLFVLSSLNDLSSILIYLILHGSFKALSFICAGEAIRSFYGYQDINRMGGLFYNSPSISSQLFLAMANLCGFPFFLGYTFKSHFQTTMINSTNISPLVEVFCFIGLASSILYFSKVFYGVAFSFKKHAFKNSPTTLKVTKMHYALPAKSPLALILIFWFMYIMSLACINVLISKHLINITSITNYISDFTQNTYNIVDSGLQTQITQNYYYYFYTLFVLIVFFVINIYPLYSVKLIFFNSKITIIVNFVLIIFCFV